MEKKYYIAQIGNMYVSSCFSTIKDLSLKFDKRHAKELNEEDAYWIQRETGAKLIEVTVTVEEKVVG